MLQLKLKQVNHALMLINIKTAQILVQMLINIGAIDTISLKNLTKAFLLMNSLGEMLYLKQLVNM